MWQSLLSLLALCFLPATLQYSYPDYYDYVVDEPATDCVKEFQSQETKTGIFNSPHYPHSYPDSTRCHYIFQGQGKERVQITFTELNLHYAQTSSSSMSCEDEDSVVVSIRINGQSLDIGRYCGHTKPPSLMSSGNRLDVMFIAHNRGPTTAIGFMANYSFVTDFGIHSGQQKDDEVCGFDFNSKSSRSGIFTSPNYPGLYPRDTECLYQFHGEEEETVEITFPFFDVEGVPSNCDDKSSSDYVAFSNFNIPDRKMGRFCGIGEEKIKKSVTSDGSFFRVVFKSNDIYDAQGFEAHYQFIGNIEADTHSGPRVSTQPGGQASVSSASSILGLLLPFILTVMTL